MSAHRFQATWRSLIFNRLYDNTGLVDDEAHIDQTYGQSDYRLESLDITPIQVTDYREVRQWLEGSEPNEAFEGLRIATGRGVIHGSTVDDLEDKTWAMYEAFSVAACRQAFAANDPAGVGPFDFRRASAGGVKALRLYARPQSGRPVIIGRMREGLSRRYIFQLVAFDPFVYAQALTQTALGNLAGGNNTVTNAGNIYTNPRIVIVLSGAGGASVTLANATTGQSFVMNLSGLAAGTYTLDVARGTFKKADGTNVYSTRISGFITSLFLAVGANTITWSSATGVTSVTFEFRDAFA